MKINPVFTFTKNEKRGFVVLLFLIMVLVLIRFYLPYYFEKSQVKKYEITYLHLREIKTDNQGYSDHSNKKQRIKKEKEQISTLVSIDPNEASYQDLLIAGFSSFVSSNIIKYRKNGGKFSKPGDLYKIYGMDTMQYELICQNIQIKDSVIKISSVEQPLIRLSINLNNADVSELEKLNGIGPVLGERILKYRKLLGGYNDINQIKEVYGITDSTYRLIESDIFVEPGTIQQINLNTTSAKILYSHPYITKYQARAIIKYREVVGQFDNIEELLSNHILDSNTFVKIKDYLRTE